MIRKKNLNKFVGSLKNQSAIASAKEQAEQHYDQMMQQQQQILLLLLTSMENF